jgi:hypothetical protein
MIFTQLLVIQLIPDFILMAAIVVIAHWIWLFGYKKGGYQPAASLKVSDNNTKDLPIETAITASFISSSHRPPMSVTEPKEPEEDDPEYEDRITDQETPSNEEPVEVSEKDSEGIPSQTHPGEPGALMNITPSQEDREKKIRHHYTGLNMVEWLLYLQQYEMEDNSLFEMDCLSRLTITEEQRYGKAIDRLPLLLAPPNGEKPSLAFLN